MCVAPQPLARDHPWGQGAARVLLEHVNQVVARYGASCAILTLREVLDLQRLPGPQGEALRVAVVAEPSGAHLEGLVDVVRGGNFRVVGEVMRFDRYGNQSYCMTDITARLYCYCV